MISNFETPLNNSTLSFKIFPNFNELKEMRKFDQNPRSEEWSKHERQFFIITDSSRPVYVRYGDEVKTTPILCTIVAFTGQLVRDGEQKLKFFQAGDKLFVFYLPFPFIYVCVSSIKLPINLLYQELILLEKVLFSLLTPQISQTLLRRPNFDIKKQTSGSERLFTSILYKMDKSHSFIFYNYIPMCGISKNRNEFKNIIYNLKIDSILGIIVFYLGEVFLIIQKKNYDISVEDIHILSNNSYPQTDSLENSWSPIYLCSFNTMLHILTVNLKDSPFKIVLLSEDAESSHKCTHIADQIVEKFKNLHNDIKNDLIPQFKPEPVLHWIIANKNLNQVHSPFILESNLSTLIYIHYSWIIDYIEKNNIKGVFYLATEDLTLIGKVNNNEIIIITLSLGISIDIANNILNNFENYFLDYKNVFFDYDPKFWE